MKILISALLLFSINAFSGEALTECYSSESCAHISFIDDARIKVDSKFTLKFDSAHVSDLKVILWMTMPNGHSHGSAPVKLTRVNEAEYLVENVWFVMKGHWDIKVQFVDDNQVTELIFPLSL